ncbi:WYL domain-containing protein [Burkholderia sp. BCC0322]|uniref:WYL domain-containing protein n=1 Tax=unclassified Burkholderia TaxID=2613784 RepID=UPI003264B9A4
MSPTTTKTANRSSGPRQPIPSSKSCIDFARESAERDTSQFRSVRLAADQRLEDRADGFVLWATVAPSVALRHLLLQHAPSVEVISPPELREEIAELLDVTLRRYRAPVTPAAERGD